MSNGKTQLDLSSATDVVCESCGGKLFKDVAIIKRLSALLSPTGKEGLIPVQTFACLTCNHINAEFDPAKASLNQR